MFCAILIFCWDNHTFEPGKKMYIRKPVNIQLYCKFTEPRIIFYRLYKDKS